MVMEFAFVSASLAIPFLESIRSDVSDSCNLSISYWYCAAQATELLLLFCSLLHIRYIHPKPTICTTVRDLGLPIY